MVRENVRRHSAVVFDLNYYHFSHKKVNECNVLLQIPKILERVRAKTATEHLELASPATEGANGANPVPTAVPTVPNASTTAPIPLSSLPDPRVHPRPSRSPQPPSREYGPSPTWPARRTTPNPNPPLQPSTPRRPGGWSPGAPYPGDWLPLPPYPRLPTPEPMSCTGACTDRPLLSTWPAPAQETLRSACWSPTPVRWEPVWPACSRELPHLRCPVSGPNLRVIPCLSA